MNPASSSSSSSSRRLPNIVITGTPGTGKTSHAQAFLEASPFKFKHVNVGELVKDKSLHEGWNEEWDSYDVDEERVSVVRPEWLHAPLNICAVFRDWELIEPHHPSTCSHIIHTTRRPCK